MHFSNFILILLCHIHSYLPFNSELPEDTEERRKFLMKEFDNVFETYKDSSSRCIALIPCQFCFFFFLSDFFFIIFCYFRDYVCMLPSFTVNDKDKQFEKIAITNFL